MCSMHVAQCASAGTGPWRKPITFSSGSLNHAPRAGRQDCVDTWRRLTVMATRFEGDVEGSSTSGLASNSNRLDFRVWPAETLVPTRADELPITDDDAADHRIGLNEPLPARGQLHRTLHPESVYFRPVRHHDKISRMGRP